jgi:Na+/melibiose symporter-like transporter
MIAFRRLLSLMLLGFGLTVLFNTVEPALIGHKVLELAPEQPNSALGNTTFLAALVGIVTQPIVGALSDRTRSRWGRRAPFLIGGVLTALIGLYLIAAAATFGFVIGAVLLMHVGYNTTLSPWQALIPDRIPAGQRGAAAGVKAVMEISALAVGRFGAGQLISRVPEWGSAAIAATLALPTAALSIGLLVTARAARETPVVDSMTTSMRRSMLRAFNVDLRAHPAFGWWFINRALFWCAFIGLSTFLLFYAIDVLGLSEAEAQSYIGGVSAILGVALLAFLIPASWLSDRIGRKPLVIAGGLIAGLGTLFLLSTRDRTLITAGAIVIGGGVGIFMTANWALVTDIVPREEAARYLGIANMATASGSAIARLLGGTLIDAINAATGTTSTGYLIVFGAAAAFFLLSTILVIPLRVGVTWVSKEMERG